MNNRRVLFVIMIAFALVFGAASMAVADGIELQTEETQILIDQIRNDPQLSADIFNMLGISERRSVDDLIITIEDGEITIGIVVFEAPIEIKETYIAYPFQKDNLIKALQENIALELHEIEDIMNKITPEMTYSELVNFLKENTQLSLEEINAFVESALTWIHVGWHTEPRRVRTERLIAFAIYLVIFIYNSFNVL